MSTLKQTRKLTELMRQWDLIEINAAYEFFLKNILLKTMIFRH